MSHNDTEGAARLAEPRARFFARALLDPNTRAHFEQGCNAHETRCRMLVEHDGRAYGLFFTLRSERFRDLGAAQSEEARRLGEELPREPWPETPRLDLPLATACGQPVAAVSALEVRALRHRSKLSQAGFARRYGIPIGTLRDWEQGRSAPGACGRAYLAVIALAPELVMRALRACRALAMNGPPVVC